MKHVVSVGVPPERLISDGSDRSISGAIRRLANPYPHGAIWSRRQIDALLQDLVKVFQSRGACLANIRFRTDDERHHDMRYIGFHSALRNDVPDEPYLSCKADPASSVGAYVMDRQRVVTFTADCPKHRQQRHKDWERVKCGINFPVTFPGIGRLARGVLALDFAEEVDWTPDILQVCFLATRKLSSLAFDHPVPRCTRYAACADWTQAFNVFMTESLGAAGVAAADILNGDRQPAGEVFKPTGKVSAQLRRAMGPEIPISRAEVGYGVKAFERGAYLLPLRFGPFPCGLNLRVLFKEKIPSGPDSADQLFLKILDVYARWADFSTPTVGAAATPLFQVSFDSRYDEIERITEWNHVVVRGGGPTPPADQADENANAGDPPPFD